MICDARKPPDDIAGFDPTRSPGECFYDEQAAEKSVEFFATCMKYTKGPKAGEAFILEPWQANILRTIFGWKRPDGSRRFRTVFIIVPRKNGKSTLIAGIGAYVLFCDAEAGAECYCAASDREQASLVFKSAAGMVRKCPGLDSRCKILDSQKRIVYDGSFFRAIPANEGGSHGFDSHLIIGDELHAWPGRDFYDVLHTSTGARTQPLEIYITTAGYDKHSICYETYEYAKGVRDGRIEDETFLPVIYEAEEGDDWTDPKVWAKANPNLGVSVQREYIERECAKAKENPAYENTFRRLHLDQWTSQESRWIPMERWRRSRAITEDPIADGAMVWGGLDLSSTVDITAWVICERMGEGYRVRGHYFMPEDRLLLGERQDRVPYSQWVKAGYITAIPGAKIDYDFVHKRILADAERYDLVSIGFDPWNAHATQKYLGEDKGLQMIEVRQGYASLSGASKLFEACVLADQIDHGNDPVLDWMADNAQVKTDENGNIRPVKPEHKSGKRVDGILATVMAIYAEQLTEQKPKPTGRVAFV